ncbi:Zn(II)2Cys6 transcription factor, partial [Aspergillus saccharolyticus JOP 1030-1]
IRRKRTSRPKSRNGCITCKIRHIKCGEEKPACSQCTRSGRTCDGYTDASQRQLHQAIVQSVPRHDDWSPGPDRKIVLVPGTREERQYVQFFCTQTASAMSGFFPSEFWNRFLPQLSHRNSAVRHAVAAVGALHQRQLQGRLEPANNTATLDDGFALQQYNKAIQRFLQQMGDPKGMEVDLMLIQCLLFICLEMLQGNNRQAMNHVGGGLRILSGHTAAQGSLDRDLLQFFCRQNNQMSYFGRPLALLDAVLGSSSVFTSKSQPVFKHIGEARDYLTNLITRCLLFVRSAQRHVWSDSPQPFLPEQLQHQTALLEECYAWFQAFEVLLELPAKTSGVLDPRGPLSMQCQYNTAITWLSTCTSLDEMQMDQYYPNFTAIACAGEKLVELCADGSDLAAEQFYLDADVIPVFYWSVQRCRHPVLRRRILDVLSRYPAREGMWDKGLHVAVLRRVLELEETELAHLPIAQRFPLEHHRVY